MVNGSQYRRDGSDEAAMATASLLIVTPLVRQMATKFTPVLDLFPLYFGYNLEKYGSVEPHSITQFSRLLANKPCIMMGY